jgi:ligand-binding SRPBCC domain-containing protein
VPVVLSLETRIAAPPALVFDLARSIDLHLQTSSRTRERVVAGVSAGLIGPGESVTWEARHFGVWFRLRVRITAFERPGHFRDEQEEGIFKRMVHDHWFEPSGAGTLMRDRFLFEAPLGVAGRAAERAFLSWYFQRFLEGRNRQIRRVAESGDAKRFVG